MSLKFPTSIKKNQQCTINADAYAHTHTNQVISMLESKSKQTQKTLNPTETLEKLRGLTSPSVNVSLRPSDKNFQAFGRSVFMNALLCFTV